MFIWNDSMGMVGATPALEDATRKAVIAAVTLVDSMPDGDLPMFGGTAFRTPQNKAARDVVAACLAHVPPGSTGIERETILATAVGCAEFVRANGKGSDGWTALGTLLGQKRKR